MNTDIITVELELITDTHRIIGYLPTGERRLSDILNSRSEDALVLESVRTTPVQNHDAPPLVREFAHVNKELIAFAIPREPPSTLEERQRIRPFEYVETTLHQVLISLPPFTITGYLHLPKGANIRDGLRNLRRTFIPISGGQAAYMPDPRVNWTTDVMIINRMRAQIFWPPKDNSA
jgi:hypothetical protein